MRRHFLDFVFLSICRKKCIGIIRGNEKSEVRNNVPQTRPSGEMAYEE